MILFSLCDPGDPDLGEKTNKSQPAEMKYNERGCCERDRQQTETPADMRDPT